MLSISLNFFYWTDFSLCFNSTASLNHDGNENNSSVYIITLCTFNIKDVIFFDPSNNALCRCGFYSIFMHEEDEE